MFDVMAYGYSLSLQNPDFLALQGNGVQELIYDSSGYSVLLMGDTENMH